MISFLLSFMKNKEKLKQAKTSKEYKARMIQFDYMDVWWDWWPGKKQGWRSCGGTRKFQRSWKSYRKTQYKVKEEDINGVVPCGRL